MTIKKYFTTKSLTTLAVFVALGYGLSWLEFPIFPPAPFLKLDFSNVITLLCGYMFGPVGAIIVEGVKQLLILLTHSDTAGVGQLANFLMTSAFVLPPALLYKFKKGKTWVVIGMALGSVLQIATALLCNRYITFPLYVGSIAKSMFASLWGYVLAFNAVKTVLISAITFLVYKRTSRLLDKMFPKKAKQKSAIKFVSSSEEETSELAKKIASELVGGEIITLDGELGAGKTVFVKGLASALGIAPEEVTSPTFTLMSDYDGRVKLCHIDAYRLSSGEEAYEAGLTEYFGEKHTVVCIEWAQNIASAISGRKIIEIKISRTADGRREIEINDK